MKDNKLYLSVVFPIYEHEGSTYVLMGKQAPGRKMEGKRNGAGGKCEDGESTLFCAKRELEEELKLEQNYGINISYDEFIKVGTVIQNDKQIDFFIVKMNDMIMPPSDNDQFVDTRWFDLTKPELFVHEMLSGDDVVVASLNEYLKTGKEFLIDKSNDELLKEQTKKIYK